MQERIEPTEEQKKFILAPLRSRIKVRAFAGAAKTTSLVLKAQHEAQENGLKGLYLAFNKSAQIEAEHRFGQTAVARTPHSMAYRVFGGRYKHKLRGMRPRDVVEMGVVDSYTEARSILDAIQGYCISAEMAFPQTIRTTSLEISPARAQELAELARKVWESMCDPKSEIPMSHDGYFKLYQLSRPRLPGDYLMVDEFQDTNPVTLDIIKNQPQPTIMVGDRYQSIYAFRGAVNAMQTVPAQFNFTLSQSFRFGPAVATLANKLLRAHFNETTPIVGSGPQTQIRHANDRRPQCYAVLTRTNAELFDHAVTALCTDKQMAFIGGVKGYGFDRLSDVQHLAMSNHAAIRDPFIRSFSSIGAMEDYAEEIEDFESSRLVQIAREYGTDIFSLVNRINSMGGTYGEMPDPDRVFATAHKSKGSTLDHVVLADDFRPLLIDEVPIEEVDEQEVHLAYMAATRPRHSLYLNQALTDFLEFAHSQSSAEVEK